MVRGLNMPAARGARSTRRTRQPLSGPGPGPGLGRRPRPPGAHIPGPAGACSASRRARSGPAVTQALTGRGHRQAAVTVPGTLARRPRAARGHRLKGPTRPDLICFGKHLYRFRNNPKRRTTRLISDAEPAFRPQADRDLSDLQVLSELRACYISGRADSDYQSDRSCHLAANKRLYSGSVSRARQPVCPALPVLWSAVTRRSGIFVVPDPRLRVVHRDLAIPLSRAREGGRVTQESRHFSVPAATRCQLACAG
jgi:hypothetical protein